MFSTARRALVTGGTRGIGLEISKMLLNKGYEVVFTGRTQKSVDYALKSYNLTLGKNAKIQGVVLDMSKYPLFEQPIPCHFDTVVHNAGMLSRDSLLNMNENRFQKMFTINTLSVVSLTKLCLPYMIKQNCGNIFFFCPPYRIDAKTRTLTPYMQSKLGQTTFMYSLADMMEKRESKIKVSGFWTDYPIYTDALIHRNIGTKEDCMDPGIIAKTVDIMLEDNRKNIHGNVMIDRDYLTSKKINTNQWALGSQTKKLDELFFSSQN